MHDALDFARAPRRLPRRSPFAMARRRARRRWERHAFDDWEAARGAGRMA